MKSPAAPSGPLTDPDPYWADTAEADAVSWHVGIRLGQTLPEPIPRSVLAADPAFADAAILRMPGGGNPFPVTDAQWKAFLSRIRTPARRRTRSGPSELDHRRADPGPRSCTYRNAATSIARGNPEVVALSDLLNRLPDPHRRPDPEKFRNANGVVLKITNFAALDPQ